MANIKLNKMTIPFTLSLVLLINAIIIFTTIPIFAANFSPAVNPESLKDLPSLKIKMVEIPRHTHTLDDIIFNMRLAPAADFTVDNDNVEISVEKDFWIGETEVTYRLWHKVMSWAKRNGYTISNTGREGSDFNIAYLPAEKSNQPVTMVSAFDSMIWCNALSEFMGYEPVYTFHNMVLKDSSDWYGCSEAVQENTNGFRLPTRDEWVLAASYINGNHWLPNNYASGAKAAYTNSEANKEVAWYLENSNNKTNDVGQKKPNYLGLFDMSGNVREWSISRYMSSRFNLGGSFKDEADKLSVYINDHREVTTIQYYCKEDLGFRIVRNNMDID